MRRSLTLVVLCIGLRAAAAPADAPLMAPIEAGAPAPAKGFFLNPPGYQKLADRLTQDAKDKASLAAENASLKKATEDQEAKSRLWLWLVIGGVLVGAGVGIGVGVALHK